MMTPCPRKQSHGTPSAERWITFINSAGSWLIPFRRIMADLPVPSGQIRGKSDLSLAPQPLLYSACRLAVQSQTAEKGHYSLFSIKVPSRRISSLAGRPLTIYFSALAGKLYAAHAAHEASNEVNALLCLIFHLLPSDFLVEDVADSQIYALKEINVSSEAVRCQREIKLRLISSRDG